MKGMKRVAVMGLVALLMWQCSESDDFMQTFKGVGTVEKTDSSFMIHYYDYTFNVAELVGSEIPDGGRVVFELTATEEVVDEQKTYTATVDSISDDITSPIAYIDQSAYSSEKYWGTTLFIPTNTHMTRDWQRNDFFNITVYYATTDGNDDFTSLSYANSEQVKDSTDLVVLWLRHYQKSDEFTDRIEYNTISVPLNELRPNGDERIRVRVKRFGTSTEDTVVTNYTYSYSNNLTEEYD